MVDIGTLIRRVAKGAAAGVIAAALVLWIALDSPRAAILAREYGGKGSLWALGLGLGLACGIVAGIVGPLARRSLVAAMVVGAVLGAPCVVVLGLFSTDYDGHAGTLFGYAFTGALTGAVAGWIWWDSLRKLKRQAGS